jgi:hypothetical protein
MKPPQNPAGPFTPPDRFDPHLRDEGIATIERAPALLRQAVANLTESQLDTLYKNWTIRQITHHLADSHVNCYTRFKLALTEETPTIKPYHEGHWAALEDSRLGDIAPSLLLFDGLHCRWVQLLRTLKPEQFERTFFHPEMAKDVKLYTALASYAWHCNHHIGQIFWLREHHPSLAANRK